MTAVTNIRQIGVLAAMALGAAASIAVAWAGAQDSVPVDEQAYQNADPALYAMARQYFPSDTAAPAPRRIFRLTRDQIDATVASLLPRYATQSIKDAMPRDALQTNYEFAEIVSLNPANIAALSRWIGDIAVRVRKDPAGVIDCADSSNSRMCLTTAARVFVVKAFRGDVGEARIDGIVNFFLSAAQGGGLNQAAGDLVEVVLNSPDFLFRKELEVDAHGRLAPAQLLQSVTYTMADAPPEALELNSRAAAAHLRTGVEAEATIAAIAASPPARDKLMRFFMAWLEVKEPADFTISSQTFPEFTPQLAAAMVDETRRYLRTELARPAPTLKDITQSTRSFVSRALEPIYGIRAVDPQGAKPVSLDPNQRLGIFSQAAVLASHSGPTDTRPIKRGTFWVRKVMCMEMAPPPPGVQTAIYEAKTTTERKRIEQLTAQPACAGCHKVIDPLGFFQENYDALGRWRSKDNGFPVDASMAIDFLDEGATKTETPVEAIKALTGSAMFKQCFVRQLFRFYMGRTEDASDDPLLRRMFFEFARNNEQSIVTALRVLVSSDRIVKRR